MARLRVIFGAAGQMDPASAHGASHAAPLSPEALAGQIDAAQRLGTLHPGAARVARRALSFGKLRAVDVMVPRNRICAIDVAAEPQRIRQILLEDGHSRLPVYRGTLDEIVGILVAKDVLALAWERDLFVLHDLVQPPYFAPQSMHAADLLNELQRRHQHLAVVVDELGGTAGLVSLEDLLEELVGEIYGEHDNQVPELVRLEPDGAVTVQGAMPVRDANREHNLGLPEGEAWSTVAGLCVSLAGRIPEQGHKLACGDGTTLEVVEASSRSVRVVRLRRQRPPPSRSSRWL